MIPIEIEQSKLDKLCQKYGISYGPQWNRFAIHVSFEKWDNGLAWALELGPFHIQRTPPNSACTADIANAPRCEMCYETKGNCVDWCPNKNRNAGEAS